MDQKRRKPACRLAAIVPVPVHREDHPVLREAFPHHGPAHRGARVPHTPAHRGVQIPHPPVPPGAPDRRAPLLHRMPRARLCFSGLLLPALPLPVPSGTRLLFRQLSLADVEAKVSALFGYRGRAVITDHACIGTDLDKAEEWAEAEKYL